jgi:hypothetical protein
MDTKDTRGPQLERLPEIVVTPVRDRPDVDRPVLLTSSPVAAVPPERTRLRRAVQLGVALGLVAAVAGGGWLAWGSDDGNDVTTDPVPAAAGPAVVAPLTLQVEPPAGVQTGQPVELVVHYADGKGAFSGSSEDWGDGVGTSSLAQGRCPAAVTPADPTSGSYRATHTWAEPGSYRVSIGVSSYTCVDGAPVEEQASTTVTVVVR